MRCFLAQFLPLALMLAASTLRGADSVNAMSDERTPNFNPPFGIAWGESENQVAQLLEGVKAQIVNTRTASEKEIWEVTGLLQRGLKETIFVFKNGNLTAVELVYRSGNWNAALYDDFFWRVHYRIYGKFGKGSLLSAFNKDEIDKDCLSWGYEWRQASTAIDELNLWSWDATGYHETVAIRYQMLQPWIVCVPLA
jgi:hypothetical protein